MANLKITVPEAGKSKAFNMTGLSAMVFSAPSYADIAEAPLLSFNDPGANLPIISGAIWPSDKGLFDNIVVTGTAASAGDQITLITVNNCLEAKLPLPDLGVSKAVCGTTFAKTTSDSVQQLSDLELTNAAGKLPSAIYIEARTADICYAFDADPDQTDFGHLLKFDIENIKKIEGIDFIQKLRFISAAATTPAELIITCEY